MNAEDLFKFGMLILNYGSYNGKQIVPKSYIKKMSQKLYTNNKDYIDNSYLSDDYYGYSLWTGKDDLSYASGSGGQYVIILKKEGIIIIVTNNESIERAPAIKGQIDDIVNKIKEV